MKKILVVLIALIFVLPLAACQTSAANSSNTSDIKRNANSWNKVIKDLEVVTTDNTGNDRGLIARSMKELNGANQSVIQGTVYNLSKLNNPNNAAYTKATIMVDKVINGKKSLKGKKITLVLNGGVTTTSRWYKDQNQTREAEHDILVQYSQAPLPKIGSKIIVGISPIEKKEPTTYMQTIKQNKLARSTTYDLNMPAFNYWIKNSDDKDYHLNNPQADARLKANPKMAKDIKNLTDELNQKYNK